MQSGNFVQVRLQPVWEVPTNTAKPH